MSPSEAKAFRRFKHMAFFFRSWARNVEFVHLSRAARRKAVENWMKAVQFWQVQTTGRVLTTLFTARHRALLLADLGLSHGGKAVTRRHFFELKVSCMLHRHERLGGCSALKHFAESHSCKTFGLWKQRTITLRSFSARTQHLTHTRAFLV
jgi:hypothetical protein